MSVKIWIETEHQPVYRAGGFAWLRHGAEGLSGAAGGFRDVDAEDLAARSLLSAVKGLPPGEAVALHLSEPRLIEGVRQLGARRAAGWKDAEGAPLPAAETWEAVAKALAGRGLSLARIDRADARKPASFCAAWAELGLDRAKSRGDVQNPIPRPNLAKVPGLPKG
jgi:hypothetical protein